MVTISSTFKNISEIPNLLNVFGNFGNDYEYTDTCILRKRKPPQCPECKKSTVHNGFNQYTKKRHGTNPKVLEEVFGDKLLHQYCLLHLNKLIVKDFPRKTSIAQELVKYRLLNIFYNREKEIAGLSSLNWRELIKNEVIYKAWIKKVKNEFYRFVHELELFRRRKQENLEINSLDKADKNFNDLFNELNSFDISVQIRLKMIKKHWKNLVMFHFIEEAPATNNSIENYYSTSLKTHRKKQFRTDIGIINQLQLSSMKRAGMFNEKKPTLFERFMVFIPFINC